MPSAARLNEPTRARVAEFGHAPPAHHRTTRAWRALSKPAEDLNYFFAALTPQALRLPRQGWTLYPRQVGSSRPLTLGSPRGLDDDSSACADAQAFRSDVARVPVRLWRYGDRGPAPIVGFGVLGPAAFERGDDVTQQPDESSRRVARLVVQQVHSVERRLIREAGEQSPLTRFSDREEVRSVVRLLTMVRHPAIDGEWYFFQARKQYGEWYTFEGKRQYKDWAAVRVHGWVHSSPARLSAFHVAGVLEDGDGKVGSWYRVTGVLRLEDRNVWITVVSGYEDEGYEFFEVGPGDTTPHSVVTVMTHAS
ncbi:MAG TPA: hypothetical protein VI485_19995 [Vicinamibacterales bacterium]|nr:hypothetical protein [Vicinamibacterales bacterium]